MSAWTSFWFWLTMLSIIGFIAVFITIQVVTNYNPPLWIWYIYGISMAFLVVGFILFCYESAQHTRVRGELQGYLEASPVLLQPVLEEQPCPVPMKQPVPVCPAPPKMVYVAPPPAPCATKQVKYVTPPPTYVKETKVVTIPEPKYVKETKVVTEPEMKKPCPLVPVAPSEPAFAAANQSSPTTRSPFGN